MALPAPKFAFFDCDGVILDSNHIKTEAFRELGMLFGTDVAETFVRYHQANGGVTRFEKIRYLKTALAPENHTGPSEQQLLAMFGAKVHGELMTCDLVGGFPETVEALRRTGTQLFVVSGGAQSELESVFQQRGLAASFLEIRGGPTPKMDLAHDLLDHYELDATKGIMFGDSRLDFEVARACALPFVMVFGLSEWNAWRAHETDMTGSIRDFHELRFVGRDQPAPALE